MKVLILGASGFIGGRLAATLRIHGINVVTASLRNPEDAARSAEGCDAVVNLAGASVAQRWTPAVKTAIRESRTVAPRRFFAALEQITDRPKQYISASAIGYYGTSESAVFDERSAPGAGFLADVCKEWESEAAQAITLGMSLTIVRTGLVCGNEGGALAKLLPIFKLGMGGRVGDGKQWYSWIHVDDVVGVYLHALDGVEGVLNATAPEPVTNDAFTKSLAGALGRPAVLPVPPFAITMMLGEGASVVLEGQKVLPKRTLETGYTFRYPTIDRALGALVGH